jgi:Cdc6-like AAA superfamily ATPase
MPSSSNSFALLPPEPKIFHGRETELAAVMKLFQIEVPRIAILGAGGMGKTSLARAVLHHPEITCQYQQHRLFVPCDTLSTKVQLAGLIGTHIGLKPGDDLTRPVIQHFSNGPPALLILDNLETLWEPVESRADVEKFLCLLTDVEHLALIVSSKPHALFAFTNGIIDHNARSRTTSQCPVDSPLPRTIETLGTGGGSPNLS